MKKPSIEQAIAPLSCRGMAVHLYTAMRVTSDIDGEFRERVLLPNDLMIDVTLENGEQQVLYFDTNYNSTFALMHEDYEQDALQVDLGLTYVRLYVISPVDLAVSKLARFAENDQEDIAALVQLGLVSSEEIRQRATHALTAYIGNMSTLEFNLKEAVALAYHIETGDSPPSFK